MAADILQSTITLVTTKASTLRALGPEGWLPLLFAVWLLLSVLTPEDVYRTFFHALIYPLTIYLLIRKDTSVVWKDPFVRLFLLFCGYMAVTTWFVGNGPNDNDVQATRWGSEAALGMVAYFLWMLSLVGHDRFWGRWFLSIAFVGAFIGLLSSLSEVPLSAVLQGARAGGIGVLEQPIQGASIATVFLAIGLFLTFHAQNASSRLDIILAALAAISVCAFVTLTLSRGPLISVAIYLVFFAVLASCQYRRPATIYILLIVLGCVVGLIAWFIGFGVLLDQLLSRGASLRLDIWTAYLTHPPESLLFGNGAGLDFKFSDAERLYLEPRGIEAFHPHNIWLGVFADTGMIGLMMQAGLVVLPALAVLRSSMDVPGKLHLLAILALFLLLTFSDEYTLLISLHPIWFFGWLPLIFVWTWSRYRPKELVPPIQASDSAGR